MHPDALQLRLRFTPGRPRVASRSRRFTCYAGLEVAVACDDRSGEMLGQHFTDPASRPRPSRSTCSGDLLACVRLAPNAHSKARAPIASGVHGHTYLDTLIYIYIYIYIYTLCAVAPATRT